MGERVVGIGVDLVEVSRIEAAIGRFGEHFERRVFTESERAYCRSMARPAIHFAARFAAKEAVCKAFGTGIGEEMAWKDIEVCRGENGRPSVTLHSGAQNFAGRYGGGRANTCESEPHG